MTNTNDMREAFKDFRDQRNKVLVGHGHNDQSKFWITNAHYTAWCRGIEWQSQQQSQQAQGEPVACARMMGGEVDWDEHCLLPDEETGISDLDGRGDSDEYEIVPLYRHTPVLANMPEQGEHTKPVADAVKQLNDWLSMGLCECEGPGHSCGATQIRNTIEALEKLLNAPPAPAAVPDDLPPVPHNEHEKKLLKEIESRDYWEGKATELAERVGEYFGFDVGEHSNANCPVQTALEADWQPPQAAVPEGYVAIGESSLVTRREYGETADEASEKMERTGFYTYEIKELYALAASPAPGHAAEADVCQNCETALPEGCGGIFAHTGTACRYDENQQEEVETNDENN